MVNLVWPVQLVFNDDSKVALSCSFREPVSTAILVKHIEQTLLVVRVSFPIRIHGIENESGVMKIEFASVYVHSLSFVLVETHFPLS